MPRPTLLLSSPALGATGRACALCAALALLSGCQVGSGAGTTRAPADSAIIGADGASAVAPRNALPGTAALPASFVGPPLVEPALYARRFDGQIFPRLEPRPDLFEARGPFRWEGRATLAGIWVAHPKATRAHRARFIWPEGGRAVDGALVPRAGQATPLISAEAARALGFPTFRDIELVIVAIDFPTVVVDRTPQEGDVELAALAITDEGLGDDAETIERFDSAEIRDVIASAEASDAIATADVETPASPEDASESEAQDPLPPIAEASAPQETAEPGVETPESAEDIALAEVAAAPEPAAETAPVGGVSAETSTPATSSGEAGLTEAEPSETLPAAAPEAPPEQVPETVQETAAERASAPAPEPAPEPPLEPALEPAVAEEPSAPTPQPAVVETSPETPAEALRRRYLAAGVFSVPSNAARVVQTLAQAGHAASTSDVTLSSGTATRVRAGPFATRAARDDALAVLRNLGISDAIPVDR
ncbi:MAG: SPOR domain-containing protein [Pseudomonadota bacterium]